jgi:hypothetical protein
LIRYPVSVHRIIESLHHCIIRAFSALFMHANLELSAQEVLGQSMRTSQEILSYYSSVIKTSALLRTSNAACSKISPLFALAMNEEHRLLVGIRAGIQT